MNNFIEKFLILITQLKGIGIEEGSPRTEMKVSFATTKQQIMSLIIH